MTQVKPPAFGLTAVVLAAGAGKRLAPLTRLLPKALCPVGDVALLDWAFERVGGQAERVAVNVNSGREQMLGHLAANSPEVQVSIEEGEALGTAGALGYLRGWVDGSDVLVTNADAWLEVDLTDFVADWDRERCRLLCVEASDQGDFGGLRYCGVALLPWRLVSGLGLEPSGLYEVLWRQEELDGHLDLVLHRGEFVDCGTTSDYLQANLLASGGANVVSSDAQVDPTASLRECVLWPGSVVGAREQLWRTIRTASSSVLIR